MADVVYLHVGAPKTGTTYLQDRLLLNKSELKEHGVSYPVGATGDMFLAAIDLIDASWGGQREAARGEWRALAARVRKAKGHVIVSHEVLSGASTAQVAQALQDLGHPHTPIHLVYAARDLGRQLPAEWQEGVKHRRSHSFKGFLRSIRSYDHTSAMTEATPWFWRAQNLPDVLARWASELPSEQVHLVVVPQAGAPRNELWHRYCTALGLEPSWAPTDSQRRNESLGIDEIAVLRRLNKHLRKLNYPTAAYRTLVRQHLAHEVLASRGPMRKVTLPPRAHTWATEVGQLWVAALEVSEFHIVGELSELLPVFDEIAAWENPDRPRSKKVAQATMVALAAVLVELNNRHEAQPVAIARLRRAAAKITSS